MQITLSPLLTNSLVSVDTRSGETRITKEARGATMKPVQFLLLYWFLPNNGSERSLPIDLDT
jgi:hypothetical protein